MAFGGNIEVQTDHGPLIPIWEKATATASPQLQWILLWLAKYDVELTYPEGRDTVTVDVLSLVRPLVPEPAEQDSFKAILVHHITSYFLWQKLNWKKWE